MLYAAPERITTPRFLNLLDGLRERASWPVRHRRGALRQPVGPRLPAGIPRPDGAARALPRRAAHRAHRHRRRPHARRHRRAAAAAGGAPVRQQLRPAQHPLPHRREEGPHAAAAALHGSASTRATPASSTASRASASRRRRSCCASAGWTPCPTTPAWTPTVRQRHQDRFLRDEGVVMTRHHRLRHGHRQAGRALRRPPGHAQEHRGLLPGDRPRRPRRPARAGLDGLRPAGRGQPAPHDRREPRRRGVQAGAARQARCAAGAGRGHRLPARAAARVLRRAVEALRQLRQLPVSRPTSGTAPRPRACCCPPSTGCSRPAASASAPAT
jgi:hypothetical protein